MTPSRLLPWTRTLVAALVAAVTVLPPAPPVVPFWPRALTAAKPVGPSAATACAGTARIDGTAIAAATRTAVQRGARNEVKGIVLSVCRVPPKVVGKRFPPRIICTSSQAVKPR
jgi:hypothetical protein